MPAAATTTSAATHAAAAAVPEKESYSLGNFELINIIIHVSTCFQQCSTTNQRPIQIIVFQAQTDQSNYILCLKSISCGIGPNQNTCKLEVQQYNYRLIQLCGHYASSHISIYCVVQPTKLRVYYWLGEQAFQVGKFTV